LEAVGVTKRSAGVGLPLARAARARHYQLNRPTTRACQRPREHALGEDRGRAGAAEHPRVGAIRFCSPSWATRFQSAWASTR